MNGPSLAEVLRSRTLNINFNLQALKIEVDEELRRLEWREYQVLEHRTDGTKSPQETYAYFRSEERRRNTINLLQYLCAFLKGLPGWREIESEPVNPFHQFCEFVKALFVEFGEEDVRKAVLRELQIQGKLTDANRSSFLLRITQLQRELIAFLETVNIPEPEDYKKVFSCLQQFCFFWFAVHEQDASRVRKTDILIFQLSTLLLERNGGA